MRNKSRMRVVKIALKINTDGTPRITGEALIHERKRAGVYQFLSPTTREALGGDLIGYFEAEKVGPVWFVGNRIPFNCGW